MSLRRVLLVACVVALSAAPAYADAPKMKTLGTDPAADGPPALDLTNLQVGTTGSRLEIRIGIAAMTPATGGYPVLPGIEWIFEVKGRTFIAEAVAGTPSPDFYLFELTKTGFTQLESPEGTYDAGDGYASILVPLDVIGARPGTRISGVGKKGTEDVDAHVHLGPQTIYADVMATTRDYVVP